MKKSHSISFQKIIRLFLQTLAVLTLIVAIGWLIFEPGFEPVLAILASVAVFLTPLFLNLEEKEKHELMSFTDECEFAPEIQLDVLGMGSIVISDSGDVANFLHDYQVNFGGRQNEMAELDDWLTQTENPFGLLVAPAGMGKSALVANWKKRLEGSRAATVVYHPISLRYGTNSQKQTLRSLLIQMSDMARKEAALEPLRSYVEGLDLIDESFSKEELQELCFHLSVDYDNLGEGGKRNKAQELIRLCQRKGRLDELVVLCREMRPRHDWDAAFSHSTPNRLLYEPPQEGDDEQILSNQLRENLRLSTGWNKPLVVIIDGLDELANQLNHSDIQEVNFLPNEVGVGVYILAVARGESVDIQDKWLRKLKWDKSPVEIFGLGTLDKEDIREMISRSKLVAKDDELILLADKIYELSEDGDPLVASLWVDRLASLEDKSIESFLELIEKGDPGINGYIEGVFTQLEPVRGGTAKPLFEVLSLARGSLTTEDLYALGVKIDSVQLDQLVSLSRRLIIRNAQFGYVFSHSRIRQAVQDKYVSEDKRMYWLERFHLYGKCSLKRAKDLIENQILVIPPYILNYYAQHLKEDMPPDYESSLYALMDEVWMKAHYEYFSNYDNFLEDVDRAWTTAKKAGLEQVVNGDAIDQISIQIKALMCHASITSLSSNLSPHLPALLVRDDIWKPKQAVSHVLRIADVAQRARALVAFLTVEETEQIFSSTQNQNLRNMIISAGVRDLQLLWQKNDVDEAELYYLQLAISPFLPVTHVNEMLLLAGKVQRSIWQVQLLAELLPLIEDEGQQIQTIKKIIHACSKIDESLCSEDIPFVVPTFNTVAENLPMKQLAVALSDVWEAESQAIKEQEQAIEQAQNDSSKDQWDLRQLGRKHDELVENRTRKKRLLDYLAWHIKNHQVAAFVELLFRYDALPQIAEKIGRFARRLDDETAYNIAIRLVTEYVSAPQEKRWSYGMGAMAEGVGMAFITLALSRKGEHQRKILQATTNYIQTYGTEDAPYGEQDLRLFYQMAVGQLTDAEAADLVKQGKFMQRFWENRGDPHNLSMYSQEIVAYLGIETLKVLFERCIQSEAQGTYWHITKSPYILPAIAENLQSEKLSLIYEIGHSRSESCGYYGYVRSATENIERMPEAVQLDTIQWALTGWAADIYLEQAIAPFITPDMISGRSSRRKISRSMAKHLPPETVQYVVNNFDVSYYGEIKGNEILLEFVQYLPEMERRHLLQNMEAELFQIKDKGDLKRTIKSLEHPVQFSTQRKMKRISRSVKTEMNDAYLLADLEEKGLGFGIIPADMIPFAILGSSFRRHVFRAPVAFFKSMNKPIRLLRLNKSSYQVARKCKENLQKQTESRCSSLLDSWLGRLYYRTVQQLASSRFIWIIYLLCMFALIVVLWLISFTVALLVFPFFVLLIGGYLLLMIWEMGKDWLKDRIGRGEETWAENKKHKAYIWKSVQSQVQALNDLSESKDREDAFVEISHTLGDVIRLIGSRDYKEYAANAEEIWLGLNPKFVLDALAVLDKRAYDESHDYVRAILPAVVFKDKNRLPDLIRYIEQPYTQWKAIQYACLSYFLTGQERLSYLEKSIAAFPYAEMSDFIIPHILTEVAEYVTPDLIPHLLCWLSDYPAAPALEKLAPKIVNNDTWLAQGFTIARKIDDPLYGFIGGIVPNLNREGVTKAIIFVMGRDLEEEQEKCMPLLVDRWLKLSQQEIYLVWQEVLEEMKGYPRSLVLTDLNWFWDVIIRLAGKNHLEETLKEILAIWSWWDVSWVASP